MLVSKISPAPNSSTRLAHATASRSVGLRPPCVKTVHPPSGRRRASMAATMHCEPKRSAPSRTSSGRWMAEVLTLTLSAPARSITFMSSTVRIPPPTVSGMKHSEAVRSTTSTMVARLSEDAVISRKTNSSAPCAS